MQVLAGGGPAAALAPRRGPVSRCRAARGPVRVTAVARPRRVRALPSFVAQVRGGGGREGGPLSPPLSFLALKRCRCWAACRPAAASGERRPAAPCRRDAGRCGLIRPGRGRKLRPGRLPLASLIKARRFSANSRARRPRPRWRAPTGRWSGPTTWARTWRAASWRCGRRARSASPETEPARDSHFGTWRRATAHPARPAPTVRVLALNPLPFSPMQVGISDYFAVPGDYNLLLLDQLLLEPRLRMVSCCNELNAGSVARSRRHAQID